MKKRWLMISLCAVVFVGCELSSGYEGEKCEKNTEGYILEHNYEDNQWKLIVNGNSDEAKEIDDTEHCTREHQYCINYNTDKYACSNSDPKNIIQCVDKTCCIGDIDFQTDAAHCGACGHACGENARCEGGQCVEIAASCVKNGDYLPAGENLACCDDNALMYFYLNSKDGCGDAQYEKDPDKGYSYPYCLLPNAVGNLDPACITRKAYESDLSNPEQCGIGVSSIEGAKCAKTKSVKGSASSLPEQICQLGECCFEDGDIVWFKMEEVGEELVENIVVLEEVAENYTYVGDGFSKSMCCSGKAFRQGGYQLAILTCTSEENPCEGVCNAGSQYCSCEVL